jgi:exosortase/archaeosortase family protein
MTLSLRPTPALIGQLGLTAAAALAVLATEAGSTCNAAANETSSLLTAVLLRALGLDAVALGDRVYTPFHELRVLDECNPLLPLALVVPAGLVARSTATGRLAACGALALVVVAANQVRLAGLALVGCLAPERFAELDHGWIRIQYWLVVALALGVAFRFASRRTAP